MVLLTLLAILVTMLLLGSASARLADTSRTDEAGTGGWGVIRRHRRRRRPLSPQARRWQTAISRAGDDDVRWAQLVDYLDSLEQATGGTPEPADRPDRLDGRYLESRIDTMQRLLDESEQQRDPAQPEKDGQ